MEKKAVEIAQLHHAGTTAPPSTTRPDSTKTSTTSKGRKLTSGAAAATVASRKVVPVESMVTTKQESLSVFLAKYHDLQVN